MPEDTGNFIVIPVADASLFAKIRTIVIDKGKGITARVGIKKGSEGSQIQGYLFDKTKGWTLDKGKEWVAEHKKSKRQTFGNILKEEDKKGKRWLVQLWKIGLTENSETQTGKPIYIGRQTSEKALPLVHGLPAMALEFRPDCFSHIPSTVDPDLIAMGFPKSQVGVFVDPFIGKNVDGSEGVWAQFQVTDDKLANHWHESWGAGAESILKFSPDMRYDGKKETIDGREVFNLNILHLSSEDVVSHPAADGKALREIFDLQNKQNMGDSKMFKKIQKALSEFLAARGEIDKLQTLLMTPTEEQLKKATKILSEVLEAFSGERPDLATDLQKVIHFIELDDERAVKVLKGVTKSLSPEIPASAATPDPAPKPDPKPAPTPEPFNAKGMTAQVDKLTKQVQAAEIKADTQEANQVIAESNIPEAAKESVKTDVARQVMSRTGKSGKEVAIEALTAKRKELKALGLGGGEVELPESMRASFGRIEMGESPKEEAVLALRGFFEGVDQEDEKKRKVKRFWSLNQAPRAFFGHQVGQVCENDPYEFMRLCGGHNYRGGMCNQKFRDRWDEKGRATFDITIAYWPDILGDEMTRAMLRPYRLPKFQHWRKLIQSPTNVKDFRTQRRLRWGGFGIWDTISEGGTYQDFVAASKPDQKEATWAVSKYGGLSGTITLEALANDDMKEISRFPYKIGYSAANTIQQKILNYVFPNAATTALTYTSGGTYVYDASHTSGANKSTTALSKGELTTANQLIMAQTAYDETDIILEIEPKYLWVPIELKETAHLLTQTPYPQLAAATAGGFTSGTDYLPNTGLGNPHEGLEPVVIGYWTDANNWYLTADPASLDFVEVGFWRGIDEPEIFTEAPNTGAEFTADLITYKGRLVFGFGITDHRGLYGGIVA